MRCLDEQYTRTRLWDPEDAPLADRSGLRGQREASEEASAADGLGSDLRQAADFDTSARSSDLSIPLRGLPIVRPNQVWGTDITYIRLRRGFVYLVAIMDWFSRYVLSWEVSVTLDVGFCLAALEWALKTAAAGNLQFGSGLTIHKRTVHRGAAGPRCRDQHGWTRPGDGQHLRGTPMADDKYEEVYLKDYENVQDAIESLRCYFLFYNCERMHQSLGYQTPAHVYFQGGGRLDSQKTGHGNGRVAMRSSIVGALQRKYFLWESSQVEYLRNPANRNFGKP